MIRVGVDAGGTFTDVVIVIDGGADGGTGPVRRELKVLSRPEDPAGLVLELLDGRSDVELVYSTTVATNALLQRSGGPTKLFTTAGFEDVLEIGRQTRPSLYALEPQKPAPLLDVEDRHGVDERIGVEGIVTPLIDAEVERCVRLVPPGTTVAVCFLHSYRDASHERMLATRLRALGYTVSVSSEVAPLPREYERTSTVVVDAYVTSALQGLEALRASTSLRIMESSGGARVEVRPARTVLSGPAAGVVAAERLAARLRLPTVVALDIGGTSTDVALIEDGRAKRVEELHIDGVVIALPSLGVSTVGAGGGSIAWIDGGGALKVGPRSAGARPGPAAYRLGGTEPTVTDAHVVLGRLGDTICGGTVKLDVEAARRALATLGFSDVQEAAHAILAVADATIARAVGATALGTARDSLTLLAYGGASGLHAVEVARRCGIARVVVPRAPGLFCASGALEADVIVERIVSWSERGAEALSAAARAKLEVMIAEVRSELAHEAGQREHLIEPTLRVRYVGQGIDGELELADLADFTDAHRDQNGFTLDRPIEVTGLRVRG
ncbi:MAG: hydantoinase/oxoprolinase family protein, partial [Polyangia bacterium]